MLVDRGNVMPRVNWGGVFAGLLAGIVVQLVLVALGVAVGAATISNVSEATSGTLWWLAISLIISSYLAGLTAARTAGYLTTKQGAFTGLITGMLFTLLVTLFTFNAAAAGARASFGLAGDALGLAGTGIQQGVGAVQDTDLGAQLAGNPEVQAVLGGLNEDELTEIVAQNAPQLSQEQVQSAVRVVRNVASEATMTEGADLADVSSLDALFQERLNNIRVALTGEDFIVRLQRQGLTEAEAQQTADVLRTRFDELRTRAQETAATVERIVRETTAGVAWAWLIAAGLIILFASLGGASGRDIDARGDTVGPDGKRPLR